MRHDDHPAPDLFPDLGERLGALVVNEPPRWWFHGLLAVPTVAALYLATTPTRDLGAAFLLLLVLGSFALCWFARLVLFTVCQWRLSAWFAVAPLCGFLCAAAFHYDVPLKARWAYAQGDFDRVVSDLTSADGDGQPDVPGRLGSYRVLGAERLGDGVRFRTSDGLWGPSGFAWFPDDPASEGSYSHLRGDWYLWTSDRAID